MKRRNIILGGAAATAFGGLAIGRIVGDEEPAPLSKPDQGQAYIPVIEDIAQGVPDAPVTLIEYASFTCSHCANFHATAYQALKSEYIDTGKIRYIYRDVFFDRYGVWASLIARCAGPDRYFGLIELIFESQARWVRAGSPTKVAEELRKIGLVAGLREDELEACLQDKTHAENLVKWYQHNAELDGIQSTPSFVIGGQTYTNMAYSKLQDLINTELDD